VTVAADEVVRALDAQVADVGDTEEPTPA